MVSHRQYANYLYNIRDLKNIKFLDNNFLAGRLYYLTIEIYLMLLFIVISFFIVNNSLHYHPKMQLQYARTGLSATSQDSERTTFTYIAPSFGVF